jgi:hypothetical protein
VTRGLVLWLTPPGDFWTNTSSDYLFRFGARTLTNSFTLGVINTGALIQSELLFHLIPFWF